MSVSWTTKYSFIYIFDLVKIYNFGGYMRERNEGG